MKMILVITSVCSFLAGSILFFLRRKDRVRFSELDMRGFGEAQ